VLDALHRATGVKQHFSPSFFFLDLKWCDDAFGDDVARAASSIDGLIVAAITYDCDRAQLACDLL